MFFSQAPLSLQHVFGPGEGKSQWIKFDDET